MIKLWRGIQELRPTDTIQRGERLHFAAETKAEAEALRRRYETLAVHGELFSAEALLGDPLT